MEKNSNVKKKPKKHGLFYNFHYDLVKVTAGLPTILLLRPKKYYPDGKKPLAKGGVLISGNHASFLDPVYVHTAFVKRRLHFLATKDLYRTKFMAWFFNAMHCIMVDKENFSVSSFHDVTERLKDGHAVVIFPEGQLNHDGANSVLAFKSGAVFMAYKSGAPILPMYIAPRKKWYSRLEIVYGDPIDVRAEVGAIPSMQEFDRLSEKLHEKELELREYYKSIHNKNKGENQV